MTAKEKAEELVKLFSMYAYDGISSAEENGKQCALIALDFALEFADDSYRSCYGYKHTMEYLEQVKQEINKL